VDVNSFAYQKMRDVRRQVESDLGSEASAADAIKLESKDGVTSFILVRVNANDGGPASDVPVCVSRNSQQIHRRDVW